jgi:GT2 family glycosyltransferase
LASRKALLSADQSVRFLHGGVQVVGDPFVIDKDNTSNTIHIDKCVLGGTFFVRRDVFDEVNGFDNVGYAEDTLFFEQAEAAGVRISRTHHPSYIYYRNVPNQLTSSFVS